MRHTHYFLYIFYIIIFTITSLSCSDDDLEIVDPPVVIPSCIGSTEHNYRAEVDYMKNGETEYKLLYSNGGVNPSLAFKKKGRINLDGNIYSNSYSIPAGDTNFDVFMDICDSLENVYHHEDAGWIFGMDSFRTTVDNTLIGWSNGPYFPPPNTWDNWSFVFVGKIWRLFEAKEEKEVVETMFTHELAHQMRIIDHGPHTGNHSTCCIMLAYYQSCIKDSFQFCDGHICQLYSATLAASPIKMNRFDGKFSCSLSSDQSTYLEGEAIWITLKVKNESNNYDSLEYFTNIEVRQRIYVSDSIGRYSEYKGGRGYYSKKPMGYFEPYEEKTIEVEILNTHGSQFEDAYDFGSMRLFFKPGSYTIQYINDNSLHSEPLLITVEKPQVNEATRLQELREIYKIKNKTERKNRYRKFITENKDSKYIEQTYGFYNMVFKSIGVDSLMIAENEWFIYNFPNSKYLNLIIQNTVHAIYNFENGKTAVERFLDNIINNFKDKKAGKIAENFKSLNNNNY